MFAQDFIYWFGERGEALPYGRSLTYRFAQGCFWSALAFTGVEVFPWGVVKGIINRHFRDWFERPILDSEQKLTLGYGYENLHMCEGYNSLESPYWALKSFLVLAFPDEHAFWQAEEMPLTALDNMLAFLLDGYYHVRRRCEAVSCKEDEIWSRWRPVEGIEVETMIIPSGSGHICSHIIRSDRVVTAVESGFALPWQEVSQITREVSSDMVLVKGSSGSSRIVLKEGTGAGGSVFCESNVNLIHPRTILPYLAYEIPMGITRITVYVEGVPGNKNNSKNPISTKILLSYNKTRLRKT